MLGGRTSCVDAQVKFSRAIGVLTFVYVLLYLLVWLELDVQISESGPGRYSPAPLNHLRHGGFRDPAAARTNVQQLVRPQARSQVAQTPPSGLFRCSSGVRILCHGRQRVLDRTLINLAVNAVLMELRRPKRCRGSQRAGFRILVHFVEVKLMRLWASLWKARLFLGKVGFEQPNHL